MDTPETTSDAPARLCANCAAGMERHQDWCLECGTAAPGRLGGLRPGWRAVTTTLALTLGLVGSAGAASYAALSSDANREAIAAAPADATPVAQAPPAVPAPAAPVVPAPAAPTVKAEAPKLPVAPKVTPIAPADTKTTAQVTPPKTVTPPTASSGSGSGTGSGTKTRSDDTAAGDRGEGTSADGGSDASDEPLEPIAVGAGAVALYDPYGRATTSGSAADAADGSKETTFQLSAPADDKDMQVGVVVDLGSVKQVRAIEFTTTTPGGRVELYATDSSTLPPDILDTRWDHPASRAGADEEERIVVPRGGERYRYVTLWFTTPPTDGPRVGLAELTILG